LTQVLPKTNPAGHQRSNETLSCPYNAVYWIHVEERKWLIPVCHVPVAVGGPRNCADSWDPSSLNMMKTNVPRDKATAMRLTSNGFKVDKNRKPFTPDPKRQVQPDDEGYRPVFKS
jgi:hypothetical protein